MDDMDPLSAAITETEKEIAGSAWGKEENVLDETGDRSIEQMGEGLEGQHEPDDDEEEAEADEAEAESEDDAGAEGAEKADGEDAGKGKDAKAGEADDGKPKKGEPEGRVPSGKLREANERARAAAAERDALKSQLDAAQASSKKELDALNAKVEGILAAIQRGPGKPEAAKPEAETVPDIFEDPKGFVDHLTRGFETKLTQRDQRLEAMRVETSMAIAHAVHKDDFTKAFDAVQKLNPRDPEDQVTVRRIYGSPNPGEALVSWHKRNETLREVGDDPGKYREKVAAEARAALMNDPEFRKELIASMKAEAQGADGGQPRTLTRLPKSLNGAQGGSSPRDFDTDDGSEQAIAASAWR